MSKEAHGGHGAHAQRDLPEELGRPGWRLPARSLAQKARTLFRMHNRSPLIPRLPMNADARPLVLVVDDYQDAREMYAEYLSFSGFRVVRGQRRPRGRREGVLSAARRHPDGFSLPGMDGWAATRQLKTDERTRRIPVVALTGHALAGASDGARQAAAMRSSRSRACPTSSSSKCGACWCATPASAAGVTGP